MGRSLASKFTGLAAFQVGEKGEQREGIQGTYKGGLEDHLLEK
jgi:hypothetical protein